MNIFFIAALICMAAVVGSLIMGFVAMGKENSQLSQKMMRFRVLFQGAAIAFLFLAYLTKH
jgi:archaellum component FlaG (FlaF/FlaG flagellin family)